MSINYLQTPDGYFVDLKGRLGNIQATIHQPDKDGGRKTWNLCFATCTGEAQPLIGKVLERKTLEAVKHDLERYDLTMNAPYGQAIPGFRGMPVLTNDGYIVLNIDSISNAAFEHPGCDQEVARILREAADRFDSDTSRHRGNFALIDANGNHVGECSHISSLPTKPTPENAIRLTIALGNAAFEGSGTSAEISRILQEAAFQIEDGKHSFSVRDINGNAVGQFEFHKEASPEQNGIVDMKAALRAGRVYIAEDGYSGIADGQYRYVVTTPKFTPGYHQGGGDAWLVNAKGEQPSAADGPMHVRESNIRELKRDDTSLLDGVIKGTLSFEDLERYYSPEDDEDDEDDSASSTNPGQRV